MQKRNLSQLLALHFQNFMLHKFLPAIVYRFPISSINKIVIQKDNTGPHVAKNDYQIMRKARGYGWRLRLVNQPLKSSDPTVPDLGLLNCPDSRNGNYILNTKYQLITAVYDSFEKLDSWEISRNFMSLQKCMECILRDSGGDSYNLPRMSKADIYTKILDSYNVRSDTEVYNRAQNIINIR